MRGRGEEESGGCNGGKGCGGGEKRLLKKCFARGETRGSGSSCALTTTSSGGGDTVAFAEGFMLVGGRGCIGLDMGNSLQNKEEWK